MRRLADHCRQFDLPINLFRVPWQGVCGPVGDKGTARRLREMPSAPTRHCLGVHCLVFALPHLRNMVLIVRASGPYFAGIEDRRQNADVRERFAFAGRASFVMHGEEGVGGVPGSADTQTRPVSGMCALLLLTVYQ